MRAGILMFEKLYDPFNRWFRPRRIRLLYESLEITKDTRVLDLGGAPSFWLLAESEGRILPRVTVLNLRPPAAALPEYMTWVVGDARRAPFADHSFDVVFSNSLIEHLFDLDSQNSFAREVERLGRSYFVQTPDRHFPIEPHFLTPFIHWLPRTWRRLLIRNFTLWGILRRPTREYVEREAAEIRLLSKAEMVQLFPRAALRSERFMGLSKSLVACKT